MLLCQQELRLHRLGECQPIGPAFSRQQDIRRFGFTQRGRNAAGHLLKHRKCCSMAGQTGLRVRQCLAGGQQQLEFDVQDRGADARGA
ncbi:MAG: hypothetical protein V4772_07950, partial [Pseudomonadota bacterium]